MIQSQEIMNLVYAAIDEVNASSRTEIALEKDPKTCLLDGEHSIDSLTFVNLLAAVEEQVRVVFGISLVLADDESLTLKDHPFRNVGTLVDYLRMVLAKKSN